MGGGDPTWIGDFFNGHRIVFPNNTEWEIGAKISEKCDFLNAERYDGLKADLSESQAVHHCCQIGGREAGRRGIMKIRMQVPTEYPASSDPEVRAQEATTSLGPYTAHELEMLRYLNERGCSVTPQLLTWECFSQEEEMPVPGGYIALLVMEEVPGVSLDDFWDYDPETRDKIRAAFRPALSEIYSHNVYPSDKRLGNIHYDEKSDKCYILDYEDVEFLPPDSRSGWLDLEYFFWGLALKRYGEETW